MPEAAGEAKSPKTSRRPRSASQTPPRQVHFEDARLKRSTASAAGGNPVAEGNQDCQPASFPALPGAAWYTAADPTRSISFAAGPPAQQPLHPIHVNNANLPPPHYYLHHNHLPHHSVTFIGHQQQQHPVNMVDYANAAPPPMGVNFQPPVPDTTFGPIPHLYVPRFDPAPQGVQQPQAGPACQPNYVVAPQQPGFVAQQQPIMINGQAYIPAPTGAGVNQPFAAPGMVQGPFPVASGGAGPGMPVMAGNGFDPEVSGLGRTPNEEMLRQIQFAHQNKLFEPQEFKPGDDDPSRFYYVREVDGEWTQRNRYTIDRMACRWYVTDEGWFYAVRLPD